jgi:hypothetical protein
MDGTVRFVDRRTGSSRSVALDPATAEIVEAFGLIDSDIVRIVLVDGRWVDAQRQEWVPDGRRWQLRQQAA